MDDDWSYVWSARIFANTGHFIYDGYTTPILGWQLYLGALFIKLFGFSFTAVRASMLVVSIAAIALTQRVFVRFGITQWNATLATLAIAVSPIFLILSFSYMSDMPGFFCLVLCLYSCVRAAQAETDRAALGWLAFAALSNVFGGTARQIAWLGALIIVPSTAWLIRRRKNALLTGVILWIVSAAIIFSFMRWFGHQPYSVPEPLLARRPQSPAEYAILISTLIRGFLFTCFFLSPVLIGFLLKYPLGYLRARNRAIAASALFLLVILGLVLRHKPIYWLAPFFFNDYYAATLGGILGAPPPVTLLLFHIFLTILTFAIIAAFLLCLWNAPGLDNNRPDNSTTTDYTQLSWEVIFTILGPYTVVYCLLLVTRESIFPRYLLPLFLVLLVPILRLYQQKIATRLPAASAFVVLFLAIYGIAYMHDLFAGGRARIVAANEIRAAGIPRTAIRAGYEYDGWTQLEATGYMNDNRIRIPANAYHPWTPPNIPKDCALVFSSHLDAIVPKYELSYGPTTCFTPSQFPPVSFHTWLSPHIRTIYIQQLP
jgi:hypothetical protein